MRYPRLARFKRNVSAAGSALAATFRRKNLKNAFRSVTFNHREYLCFYLALLLIQTGFCAVILCHDADLHHARDEILKHYDYHFEIACLDNDQMSNLNNEFLIALEREDPYLAKVWYTSETDGSYTFFVTVADGQKPEDALSHVRHTLLSKITSGYDVRTSPLYEYDMTYRTPYMAAFWGTALAWLVLSMAVLVVLYLIRLDHFRFTYGIYMTCGADFPMLYAAAAGEMLAISALTLLPSVLLGVGVMAMICLPRGVNPALSLRTVFLIPAHTVLVPLLAVFIPMRILSRKTPMQLLAAKDTSSLVTSPTRSFRLFGASFPGRYELCTFWRMRKYYARLVFSAVLFAALFVSGLYVADLQAYKSATPAYEYVITYTPIDAAVHDVSVETGEEGGVSRPDVSAEEANDVRTDADYFLLEVNAVPGVSYTWWQTCMSAGERQDHLLIQPSQLAFNSSKNTVISEECASQGYKYATRDYDYTAVDQTYLSMLTENGLCTVEGDPYAVLTDDKQVILTEDVYNQQVFHFSPGDKIMVARFQRAMKECDMVLNPQELLRWQIDSCQFLYEEYTVCAVIRGLSAENHITLGVSFEEFADLTGAPALRDEFHVYMQNGTNPETVREAEAGIRQAVSCFSGWTVAPTGYYFESYVKSSRNQSGLTIALAALLLIISPVVWLFSQIMFYRKRRGELDMLYALGAPHAAFPTMHRMAGGVLSALAFLITVGLSCLFNWVVYILVTVILPQMGVMDVIHYRYTLSIPALIACVAISVSCGLLSCEIPWRLYRRQGYGQRQDY